MPRLYKLLIIFGLVVMTGGYVLQNSEQVSNKVHTLVNLISNEIKPCSQPLEYSLGTFDTNFGLSRESFLQAMAEAEAVWEKPYGRELFTHDPLLGELKINLIYDYRQETTSKLKTLDTLAKAGDAKYDALKVKYDALKRTYAEQSTAYEVTLKAFNIKYDAYNNNIKYWNDRGGAPKEEYEKIRAEESVLKTELAALNATRNHLNSMTAYINSMVDNLNSMASSLNQTVNKYNAVGATLGESFEEGLYVREGGKARIDIYEFTTRDDLVRVLAHELGHALGLEHVGDPQAIMYSKNHGQNKTLTKADMVILQAMCGN